MYVSEVVEEIQEKLPNNLLNPTSILRKITQVRDRLIRNYNGAQQQSEAVCTAIDMIAGQNLYPIPAPAGSITEVVAKYRPDEYHLQEYGYYEELGRAWYRLEMKQFDQISGYRPYYYLTAGRIGIYPTPTVDMAYGIKVFHNPVLFPLTIKSLDGLVRTGFDPNFDMLLVYGVLKDMATGGQASEFQAKYQEMYNEYVTANSGYETYRVKERW